MAKSQLGIKHLTAIILAGGFGTRLKSVGLDCPKPMASVLGRPFLDHLVEYLTEQTIPRIIIAAGHRGDQVSAYFESSRRWKQVLCVREPFPLGTGGAISYAIKQAQCDGFALVLNGDSIVQFSLKQMLKAVQSGADMAMLGVQVPDARRFGTLAIDKAGNLTGFKEKSTAPDAGLVNAGVYLLKTPLIPSEPSPASMERDYIPRWLEDGKRIAVVRSNSPFLDIGTPESFSTAADFMRRRMAPR